MQISARQVAYNALVRVEKDQSYSNIILDNVLTESTLSQRDRSFAAHLFYGVIETKLLLEYNLAQFSDRPANQLSLEVKMILKMGLYQIFLMDSVPNAAAVNESVKLCKDNKLVSASGYVNGVLRAASRQPQLKLPNQKKSKNKYYSIKYSCPEPMIKLWRQSYGDELTIALLQSLSGRPTLSARVNTLKTTPQQLKEALEQQGVTAEYSSILPDCLLLADTGAVEKLPQYRSGEFHIQDSSSQLCCRLLDPQEGNTVLDVCSAPGGKSFTMAQMMNNKGNIISCDLYDARLRLVSSGAKRLGIDIIHTLACDSSQYDQFPQADRVLCDVPCSGLGIIGRKPELRYKENTGTDTLPELQYSILCHCAGFVKNGGLLVYSTCTLNPKENNQNARRFLEEHREFEAYRIRLPEGIRRGITENENELTLFPHINLTDGFFISVFQRK